MKTPISFIITLLLLSPKINFAQAPVLGDASPFAIFTAVGAFNNNGNTVVTGDIGTNVGAFSGFPPGIVIGAIHVADLVSSQAAPDVDVAYSFLAMLTCGSVLGTTMGSGQVLTPDIYCLGAASTINGNLVLDAEGDPDALFIFQIDGALSTGVLANVVLINGASLCNVFWQVNGEFSLGDGSVFRGTLINNGAIHLLEASSLFGRALSRAGAIDLHNNVVSVGFPPVASVITPDGPTTFCAGGSVNLSGNTNGTWNTGAVSSSINVTTSGNYFVINTTLCGSDTSNHIIVTVSPDTAPSVFCPPDVALQCGQSTLPVSTGSATASDTCDPNPSVGFTDITVQGQQCLQAYSITRTWTATDASGQISSCVQEITISDTTSPTIECPPNMVIQCDADSSPANTGNPTANDSCDPSPLISSSDVLTPSGVCAQAYTITRTWSVTDDCGNNSTCVQMISIVDTTAPVISCPSNVIIACGSDTSPASTGVATGSDNCDATPGASFTDVTIPAAGCPSINRTWTLTDDCGNFSTCTQTITVTNGTSLSINCPGALAVQCASQVPAANITLVVTSGNCDGIVTVTFTGDVVSNQTCLNRYNITRTYTATDACGNVATCSQAITVFDNTPPSISCPGNLTVQCTSQVPAATVTGIATADNCGGIATVSYIGDAISSGPCANRYTITRTYRSTDECGNFVDCNQTITVFDNTPPSLTCPGNITVQCASQVPAATVTGIATADNCGGIATVSFIGDVITPGTCANRYTITRTYRSTDGCGNFFDCNQTINVFDNTPPTISCPGNTTVQCASQVPAANPVGIVTADNCGGIATVSFNGDVITQGICANRFTVTRTYRSTDACGNFFDCNQTITVFDNTPPSLTCPGNITVQCATQIPAATVTGLVTVDNCGGTATVSFIGDVITNQTCANRFTLTRTYRTTDACGNFFDCNQIITVFDNSTLSIICPANLTVQCAALVPAVNLNLGVTSAACGGTTSVSLLSAVVTNQICANQYTLTRTYLATDACAQSATCVQVITVFDNTPPTFTLPNGLINGETLDVQCFGQDPNWDLPTFDENSITANDNCAGNVTVLFNRVLVDEGSCEADGYINLFRLTWTATDDCGNSSSAFIFLALVDTISPVISGVPADITVNCDSIPDLPLLVTATDECLCACIILVQESDPMDGCQDGQVVLRTWTAKDRCGNSTTETQRITLINNQPPTLHLLLPEITGVFDGAVFEYTCSDGGIPAFYNQLNEASIAGTSACGDPLNITFDINIVESNNCEFTGYIEQHVYHWEVIDLCGNQASMTITVGLIDNEAPVLTGVPSLTCIDDPLSDVDATDNCGEAHVRYWETNIPNPCGIGTAVRRTYEAYDDCGNMSRDTVVLIPNDLTNPSLEFVNPMLDSLGLGEIFFLDCAVQDQHMTPFGTNDVISLDPCRGPVELSFSETLIETGDCTAGGNVALMQLLWTATDVCGNLSTLTATASIEDKTSPVFVGLVPVVHIGCIDSLPEYVATDNCGSVTVTISDRYFYDDCPTKYDVEREITATDPCGNKTVFIQTVHVGGGGPIIEGVIEEICDDLSLPLVSAFDECEGVNVEVMMVQDTLEEECRGLVIQRTWTAIDACGDTTEVKQIIVIGDTIPPQILIPSYSPILLFLDEPHNVVYLSQSELIKKLNAFDDNSLSVSDDCIEVDLVFTLSVTPVDCSVTGYSERRVYTWVAKDACGNSSSIIIVVDIIDDMPPVIINAPNDTTIVCEPLPVVPFVQSEDFSQSVVIVFSETISPDNGSGIFIVTRTWTVTDICDNTSVTTQVIEWIPNSTLVCNINLPEIVECNSHGVIITSDVTGGYGPYTYEWVVVGNKCFIQGGQGTPDIAIYMGWSDVKIILNVTDAFGCVSMCMTILHCLEPGEIPFTAPLVLNVPVENHGVIQVTSPSLINEEQEVYLRDLRVWPNPAKETISFSFESSTDDEVVYSFTNLLGQVILTDKIDAHQGLNRQKIDLDKFTGGSYLMEIKSEKEMHTKVVVILPRN